MNSYVSELFARERAADFKWEADRDALAQLGRRTKVAAPSPVGSALRGILAAIGAAIGRIGLRREPADHAARPRSANEA